MCWPFFDDDNVDVRCRLTSGEQTSASHDDDANQAGCSNQRRRWNWNNLEAEAEGSIDE